MAELNLTTTFEADEGPAFGRFTFVLGGDRPGPGFTLCLSMMTRVPKGALIAGARLIRRYGNYHEFAPTGEAWPWTFTVTGLSHRPKHRLDGPKRAWLARPDGGTVDVTTGDLLAPGEAQGPLRSLPAGEVGEALALTPWPDHTAITAWRDDRPLPVAAPGSSAPEEEALARTAALESRLFGPVGRNGTLPVRFRHDPARPGDRHELTFDEGTVTLEYSTAEGRDQALVSLFQITGGAARDSRFRVPAQGRIGDAPRFAWRGCHLDVCRHFRPEADILRFLDILAWLKFNRFHWHLTDDEGWRLEIRSRPELQRVAAWRGAGLKLPPQHDSGPAPYGGYYTRAAVTRILAHAARHHIAILPEIDLPGHSAAALAACPDLADPGETPDSYRAVQGYPNNALNPAVPAVAEFLADVMAEVAELFPFSHVHVGADEVGEGAWLASPLARSLMDREGIAGSHGLQARFLRELQQRLAGLGKSVAAWDEAAFGGGIARPGTLLMAWQGREVVKRLLDDGYDVIACPGQATYLDMVQAPGWMEPGASWAGVVPADVTYAYDPAESLAQGQPGRLVGVQACIWTEHLAARELFNHLVFPRLGAVAELAWTAPARKSFPRFSARAGLLPLL